jgi:hypothetical protein
VSEGIGVTAAEEEVEETEPDAEMELDAAAESQLP